MGRPRLKDLITLKSAWLPSFDALCSAWLSCSSIRACLFANLRCLACLADELCLAREVQLHQTTRSWSFTCRSEMAMSVIGRLRRIRRCSQTPSTALWLACRGVWGIPRLGLKPWRHAVLPKTEPSFPALCQPGLCSAECWLR